MNNFTFSDFEKLSKEEERLQRLLNKQKEGEMQSPTASTISTILNYSKALSIKKSKEVDYIEQILN